MGRCTFYRSLPVTGWFTAPSQDVIFLSTFRGESHSSLTNHSFAVIENLHEMSEPMVAKVHVEDMHVFFDLMTLKLDVFGHHNRLLVWFVCDLTHCMSAEVQHPPWWWQQHAVIIVFRKMQY